MKTDIVSIVLFGWIPVIFALFCALPPRRAVLAAFLTAWLFLPVASLKIAAGIPMYDKTSATCAGIMAAAVLLDFRRLASLAPTLFDIPMAIWCLCPFVSSLSNDLGPYDGCAAVFSQTVTWGLPYLIGRLYFRDLESLRELAVALFIGGLVYVPLCLLEIKMSPQLHNWIYGYQQNSFVQTYRMGGWRPTVFMSHGLMVGMWMCMTALIGVWLWYSRLLKTYRKMPLVWAVLALLATAILCKSTGAIILLAAGMGVLFASHFLRMRAFVWALVIAAPLYMVTRGAGMWDGSMLVDTAQSAVNGERADSLAFRIRNEDLLAEKALQQPLFGWGGWSRNRVFNGNGVDLTITDGLWIIILGVNGALGLTAWTLSLLLPCIFVLLRFRVAHWRDPLIGPAIVLSVVVLLYVIDCIPNAMANPIFTLCVGGIASVALARVPATGPAAVMPRRVRPSLPRPALMGGHV